MFYGHSFSDGPDINYLMYQNKKKQKGQIDLPYSVQIEKNNWSMKFGGPCGHSSIHRKKIDLSGIFLLNIEKKNFSFRTINFIDWRDLKKLFVGGATSYIKCMPYTPCSETSIIKKEFLDLNRNGGTTNLYKNRVLQMAEKYKKNHHCIQPNNKYIPIKILELPLYKNHPTEELDLIDFGCFRPPMESYANCSEKKTSNKFPYSSCSADIHYNYEKIVNKKKGIAERSVFLRTFKKLIINNKLLINKAFSVAYGYSVFLQLIGLGYRFTVQTIRPADAKIESRSATETNYLQRLSVEDNFIISTNFLNNNINEDGKKIWRSYRSEQETYGVTLSIAAGFSHKIKYIFPPTIRVFQLKFPRNKICLFGIDKDDVLNCASQIKQIHPPSTYKGKGIRINNEIALIRPGKKNK